MIEGRLDQVGAEAHIEGDPRAGLPGVLHIHFEIGVAVLSHEIVRGLPEGRVHSHRGVGETEARVEWISGRVAEIVDPAGGQEGRLVLAVTLHVGARFDHSSGRAAPGTGRKE